MGIKFKDSQAISLNLNPEKYASERHETAELW